MEDESLTSRKMRDQELNDALDAQSDEELEGLSMRNQRLARCQQYEEEAAARPGAFAAIIGMGNVYLQQIFDHLGSALLEKFDSRPHKVEEIREYTPEIHLMVKLRSAIETDREFSSTDFGPHTAELPHRVNSKKLGSQVTPSSRAQLPKHRMRKT